MLLKIIVFIAAALPVVMFVRSVFFRRPTRLGEGLREFKTQFDRATWVFIGAVGVVFAIALGKLIWTWWAP